MEQAASTATLAQAVTSLERDRDECFKKLASVNSEIHEMLSREKAYLGMLHAITSCSYEELRHTADVYAAWGAPDVLDRALRKFIGAPKDGYPLPDCMLEVLRRAALDRISTSQAHRERMLAMKIIRDKKTGAFRLMTMEKGKDGKVRLKHGGDEAAALEEAMRAGREG